LGTTFPLKDFVTEVSPNDSMFDSSNHYVSVGLSALKMLDYAVDHGFTRPNGLRTILDLPCGHGRVARVLRSRFPSADLTVCDLDRDGVDFCANKFGATGVYSTTNFDAMDLGQLFDLIWVGSIITHFNPDHTVRFIRCMERHLCEDGLLILTSHGKGATDNLHSGISYGLSMSAISNLLRQYHVLGYGFEDYTKNNEYGVSIISRQWFEGFFSGEAYSIIAYLQKAWDNHHDVLFVKNGKNLRSLSDNRAPLTTTAGYAAFRLCHTSRAAVFWLYRALRVLVRRSRIRELGNV